MEALFKREHAYKALTLSNIQRFPEWNWLSPQLQEGLAVVGQVLPFRTNTYVTRNLIDWSNIPDDPIFRLVFPHPEMLPEDDYEAVRETLSDGHATPETGPVAREIQKRLNPHPAGQFTHNVPVLEGRRVEGIQHKYRETVLFFPAQGQTCHAFCTYCFRWPQFMKMPGLKFQAKDSSELVSYLKSQPQVTDLLLTGGDPMIMRSRVLRRFLEPVLEANLPNLQSIRIGTKSLSYWPDRFVSDADADDVLRLFEEIVASNRHLALMAHFSHYTELEPPQVKKAIRRIRNTGVEIRTQAPLIQHVNDDPLVWEQMWRNSVRLGMVPYYMFIERDTGPKEYFQLPLHRAHRIYRDAIQKVSGLARTVRGPSMSAFPGKVQILGTAQVGKEKVFALQFLQAREPAWVGRPFFAEFNPNAYWLDDLQPAFGKTKFFFEREDHHWAESTVA